MIRSKALAPTQIKLSEGRFRLHARLRFSKDCNTLIEGIPLKERILNELKRQFSHQNPYLANMAGNAYDFPEYMGKRIKIAAKFEEVQEPPYVFYHYVESFGICVVPMFIFWRHAQNKHIFLFNGDIRNKRPYTPLAMGKLAAHEFGHALGINDLYGGPAPYAFSYRPEAAITEEMPPHDIMRTHFVEQDWYTPNDLEMAYMAQEKNKPQSHVALPGFYRGLNEQSEALRLQAYAEDWKETLQANKRAKREKMKKTK